jgi:hypothetical protein
MLQEKMGSTREAIALRKLRVDAMGEFIMRSTLHKGNTVGKSWLSMAVLAQTGGIMMKKLAEHRYKVQQRAQVKAMTAITFFILNKSRQKRRRKSADLIVGFLKFIQRDGQIKSIAKKLKWILMKLQKMMHERQVCNAAQAIMIGKKFDIVTKKYLEECAKKRAELEVKAKKIMASGKKVKPGMIPDVKMPLTGKFRNRQIADWVIKNRQKYVTKLMSYEEYELWPVAIDIIREKSLFGNPFEARKFCMKLRKKGKLYEWVVENGGGEFLEVKPRYVRIPTEQQIVEEMYEPARERSERMTKQQEELDDLMATLRVEMGLDEAEEEEGEGEKEEEVEKEEKQRSPSSPLPRKGGGGGSRRRSFSRDRSVSSVGGAGGGGGGGRGGAAGSKSASRSSMRRSIGRQTSKVSISKEVSITNSEADSVEDAMKAAVGEIDDVSESSGNTSKGGGGGAGKGRRSTARKSMQKSPSKKKMMEKDSQGGSSSRSLAAPTVVSIGGGGSGDATEGREG